MAIMNLPFHALKTQAFAIVLGMLLSGSPPAQTITPGYDWSLPAWSQPLPQRFYSENASPAHGVDIRVVDLSWRQLNPQPGVFSRTTAGVVDGMTFPSLDDQLAQGGPYWLRIWTSGSDWAPDWVVQNCNIQTTWPDAEGQASHLPIWNSCVWNAMKDLFRQVWLNWGLLADPNLQFTHVPGAFYYTEFDFDIPFQAAQAGQLSFSQFDSWFHQAMTDLVNIANGENQNPDDDYAWKLVYTGEDYPFDDIWNGASNLFARDAVQLGMGIRNGITELANFHLNHAPAWGLSIAADGHVQVDEGQFSRWGQRTAAGENECFNACGYTTADPEYAVRMANLKVLQMRANRLYVVPADSYMNAYPQHWNWVRHELGKDVLDAPDAWVALRRAEDTYWDPVNGDSSHSWNDTPWVRNLERWLVQRNTAPDGQSRDGTGVRNQVLTPENGQAIEGRRTDHANGQDWLYFFLDDRFADDPGQSWQLLVTYVDNSLAQWQVQYHDGQQAQLTPALIQQNDGQLRTARFDLGSVPFANALPGGADLRIYNGGAADVEIPFVRLLRLQQPLGRLFSNGFE